jgi:hypothetical protein
MHCYACSLLRLLYEIVMPVVVTRLHHEVINPDPILIHKGQLGLLSGTNESFLEGLKTKYRFPLFLANQHLALIKAVRCHYWLGTAGLLVNCSQ